MNDAGRIPVIVGVTGHRDLREEDIEILKKAVKGELEALQSRCPHSSIIVMTSLAEGADQLCAEVALDMGLELISILPMPLKDYAKDFETMPMGDLIRLADASSKVIVTPYIEEYDDRYGSERDWLYRQAGLYVAKHSHVLMALWDGSRGDECGCGTASIVTAMLDGWFRGSKSGQLHPDDRAAIQIVTPRSAQAEPAAGDAGPVAGEVIMHGNAAALNSVLRETEIFNLDAEQGDLKIEISGEKDRTLAGLRALYESADSLSMENAVKHRRLLAGLSTAATVLAMSFLLYDEADWFWMILVCGVMIIALFLINRLCRRSKYQARYLEYRVLAESLRVQYHLRSAGVGCEVSDIMPWNIQLAMPWVRKAAAAMMTGAPPLDRKSIRDSWVIDQRDYHRDALKRTEAKLKSNDRILRVALIMTLLIYALALVFEIGCGGLLGGKVVFPPEVNDTIRMYIKIAMGTFSAGTLFAGNYYGKQALPNMMDDHRKMVILYEEAAAEIGRLGENEDLLIRLAENELAENANWYAYQSKNEPELGI